MTSIMRNDQLAKSLMKVATHLSPAAAMFALNRCFEVSGESFTALLYGAISVATVQAFG